MNNPAAKPGIRLILITNETAMARCAAASGVARLFVDLEIMGKQARQGHLDTHITSHDVADIARVRAAAPDIELIVRVNPLHDGTEAEIDRAIADGADTLMLPMFCTASEIARVSEMIAGRAGFLPLVETPEALAIADQVLADPGVTELYIGLNDLHLATGRSFMFEFLAEGVLDRVAKLARAAGKPFGFGGIARMDEGLLSGRMVLGEHLRLGSGTVILSRTFKRAEDGMSERSYLSEFTAEIEKLRDAERALSMRNPDQVEADRIAARDAIMCIAESRAAQRQKAQQEAREAAQP